jgi:flagellin FlaB
MTATGSRRARIGIGTLVVFLSMALVASIAAGVLIDATGVLGGGTPGTGSDSGPAAPDGLLVIGTTGSHVQDGTIGVVNLTVTAGPDAAPIELREATVSWVGPDGAYEIGHPEAPDGGPTYAVTPFGDGSAAVIDGPDDRAILTFDLGETDDVAGIGEFGRGLRAGDAVKVTLVTGDGRTTTTRLAVPRSLEDRTVVPL